MAKSKYLSKNYIKREIYFVDYNNAKRYYNGI